MLDGAGHPAVFLDLGRPDQMSSGLDHVVLPAAEPQVAVGRGFGHLGGADTAKGAGHIGYQYALSQFFLHLQAHRPGGGVG